MSFTHVDYTKGSGHGQLITNALGGLESGLEYLQDVIATIPTMLSGNPSDEASYDEVTSHFGFTDNAMAKSAYDELSSLLSKLSGNGSVTDVNAALLQAFNKFR